MRYKTGDYFGERALICNTIRDANVIAQTDCVVLKLERHILKRILGSVEGLLKRNF